MPTSTPKEGNNSSGRVISTQSYTHVKGSRGQERLVFVAEASKPPPTHYIGTA